MKQQVAHSALATELNRRVTDEQPKTWPKVVSLGVGVARAVLDEEPKQDPRPWYVLLNLNCQETGGILGGVVGPGCGGSTVQMPAFGVA